MSKHIQIVATLLGMILAGCSEPSPTAVEKQQFDALGPAPLQVKPDLPRARVVPGPYRVAEGDLLSLTMPSVVQALTPDAPSLFDIKPLLCRVTSGGSIDLPYVGSLKVSGKPLAEIEQQVIDAYFPRYLKEKPLVVAQVAEFKTHKVSILGGVDKPGVYDLRSDEMSLAAAIMKAGGILKEGSSVIHVQAPDQDELILPVADQNVPAVNLALRGGETVTVERLSGEVFTVVGLVNKGGTFAYPPGTNYSLAEALGFAGGLNNVAEPDYLRIVRKDSDNKSHTVVVNVAGKELAKASDVPIRPGDMIFVEQTAATKLRQFAASFFGRLGINGGGTYQIGQ